MNGNDKQSPSKQIGPVRWLASMLTRPWLGIALVTVALLGYILLVKYGEQLALNHEPDINNLPIYPGARSVTTRDNLFVGFKDDGEGHDIQTGTTAVGKITDYQTNAKPEDVLAFYERAMPTQGWPVPTQLDDGRLLFMYVPTNPFTGRVTGIALSVTVETRATDSVATVVELNTGP